MTDSLQQHVNETQDRRIQALEDRVNQLIGWLDAAVCECTIPLIDNQLPEDKILSEIMETEKPDLEESVIRFGNESDSMRMVYNSETKILKILAFKDEDVEACNENEYDYLGKTEDGGHYYQVEDVEIEDFLRPPEEDDSP